MDELEKTTADEDVQRLTFWDEKQHNFITITMDEALKRLRENPPKKKTSPSGTGASAASCCVKITPFFYEQPKKKTREEMFHESLSTALGKLAEQAEQKRIEDL